MPGTRRGGEMDFILITFGVGEVLFVWFGVVCRRRRILDLLFHWVSLYVGMHELVI